MPVHQMQKAGAFIRDFRLTSFFAFLEFYGSLLHLVTGGVMSGMNRKIKEE